MKFYTIKLPKFLGGIVRAMLGSFRKRLKPRGSSPFHHIKTPATYQGRRSFCYTRSTLPDFKARADTYTFLGFPFTRIRTF